MARRSKTSPLEDMIDLAARLPWWAGLLLAVLSYLLLHRAASTPAISVVQPGQFAELMSQTVWKAAAGVGQYLLPFICVVGAGISALRRHQRSALIAGVADSRSASALNDMSWQQFEQLVGEAFRLQGYRVLETGGPGADGGVDLVLSRGGEKFLVQCKQWKALRVDVKIVRELYGVMAATGAAGGFVVTSGRFTDPAIEFASGRNLELIDGPQLHALIRQTQVSKPVMKSGPAMANAVVAGKYGKPEAAQVCPSCAAPMVRRHAKNGRNAGNEFWGCSQFPSCRGTRPID